MTVLPLKTVVNPLSSTSVQIQHTLRGPVVCNGIGIHSGRTVNMTLYPAPEGSGIVFVRTDESAAEAEVPAHWSLVRSTVMNSGLANAHGVAVGTVEHLMSALAGLGVDNCRIQLDGPEVPVLDGSARLFLERIDAVGLVAQAAPRRAIRIVKPVTVEQDGKLAALYPTDGDGFSLHFEIDFPSPAIARQERSLTLTPEAYRDEISKARTFGFEQEVSALQAAGLALGGSLDNAVVINATGTGVLNEGGLRYPDEFVRHKILDAVGDLYLAGAPIVGHFHGIKSGHALNNQLLRTLFAAPDAWEWTVLSDSPSVAPVLSRVVNG